MGDLTDLLAALTLTGVTAGIVASAVVKSGPVVTKWGVSKVLSMFGR